jgi:DNA-binding transcriptional ArsR family regulator
VGHECQSGDVDIAHVARLIGEPARAAMLDALVAGRALAAGELARAAGVKPATASEHLAKLVHGGLVTVEQAGRHRYYRLSAPEVGQALEALSVISPARTVTSLRQSNTNQAMALARTCYDHLAGRLGVVIYRRLVDRGSFVVAPDGLDVTSVGENFLTTFGVDVAAARAKRRTFARPCLDYTERTPHLAGAIGASVCARMFELDWVARRDGRALRITREGAVGLADTFGMEV